MEVCSALPGSLDPHCQSLHSGLFSRGGLWRNQSWVHHWLLPRIGLTYLSSDTAIPSSFGNSCESVSQAIAVDWAPSLSWQSSWQVAPSRSILALSFGHARQATSRMSVVWTHLGFCVSFSQLRCPASPHLSGSKAHHPSWLNGSSISSSAGKQLTYNWAFRAWSHGNISFSRRILVSLALLCPSRCPPRGTYPSRSWNQSGLTANESFCLICEFIIPLWPSNWTCQTLVCFVAYLIKLLSKAGFTHSF